MDEFISNLDEIVARVGADMECMLPPSTGPEESLVRAMRHGALAGGKRLRPYLVVETGRLFKADDKALIRVGSALEFIHAYSLIHDDLPCMDDDDMRRGQPSVHYKFGEAAAVLAGDSLLSLAFAVLSAKETHPDPKLRCDLVEAAARRSGVTGMVGGQMLDLIISEKKSPSDQDLPLLTRMLRMKTGSLFALAADFGAILGHADMQSRHALSGYTHDLGMAYQIADDLKDEEDDDNTIGIIALLGREAATERLRILSAQAKQHLAPFGAQADNLARLVDFIGAQGQ